MAINRMDIQLWNIHTMKHYLAISLSLHTYIHTLTFILTPKSVPMENYEFALMSTIPIQPLQGFTFLSITPFSDSDICYP